jgi:cytoskeletal protein RodZ
LEYNSFMQQTIGQKLKEIRESEGISLEEIAQKTHIRLNYLQAIESNEVDQLLSTVQVRGFLRLYASELGVNLDELVVKEYVEKKPEPPELPEAETEDQKNTGEESITRHPDAKDERLEATGKKPSIEVIPEEKPIPNNTAFEIRDTDKTEHATAIFKAIGAKLQARRNLLSLSHVDIADNLHIRKEFLEALETGQFEVLPSPVQTRGMLANYAEFLNLDVDDILLEYADGLQVKRIEKQKKDNKREKKSAKELSTTRLRLKNFFSTDLLMITILFLGFAVFVIWGVNRILAANSPDAEATDIPEVADVLLATGSPTPQISNTPLGTLTTDTASDVTPAEPTPIFTTIPNNNPINILIIPRQNTWVQITADSDVIFVGRLISGNVYDFSGDESVEIYTGNAGALQILFNDQDIGSPGLIGQVVNLIFTESGLVQPTPTNTPTITETPRPSASPTATPTSTQTRMPTATPTENDD